MTTPANPADLIAWLRAALDEIESDARFYLNSGADNGPGMEWAQLVLAEVDAKRRILEFLEYDRIDVSKAGGPPETVPGRRPAIAHPVLRILALPYADRPGYRQEWAPTSAPA